MTYKIVGREIGDIGFGLMGLTARQDPLSEEAMFAAIKAALDSGCNYFNGGEFYGPPNNNSLTLLNKYFAKYPEDAEKVVLNVKGGLGPGHAPRGAKADIQRSMDNALAQLGPVGRIDQFQAARRDKEVDYEEDTLASIDEYVKAGKIGGIAASEINAVTLRSAAKKYKITALEIEFSLFTTEPLTNGLLEACAELDIPILAYSPLGRGFLCGNIKSPSDLPKDDLRHLFPRFQGENFYKNVELVNKVQAIAEKKGCTTGQIALGWLLSISKRPGMPKIIPIPGSSNPDRIRENGTIVNLTAEELSEIDQILASFTTAGERYPEAFMKDVEN